jgi:hypothetical protein
MSDSPKPILKRSATDTQRYPSRTHGVHFPPSPATRTYSAYSASAYDRSPIVVAPNNCALPERGGRTYTLEDSQPRRGISFARDFHPRALAFATSRSDLPQLIPDLSSESDESDCWSAAPTAFTTSHATFGIHGLAGPPSRCNSGVYGDADVNGYANCVDALAFLPYPPSPPSQKYQYAASIDPFPQNYRRRRGDRETKHESSRDPDRIPSRDSDTQLCHSAFASLSISSSPTCTTTTKRSAKKKQPKSPHTPYTPMSAGFGNLDDGCLGGFWNNGIFPLSPMHCTISASQTGLDLSFPQVPLFIIRTLHIFSSKPPFPRHITLSITSLFFLLCGLHWPYNYNLSNLHSFQISQEIKKHPNMVLPAFKLIYIFIETASHAHGWFLLVWLFFSPAYLT